MATQRTRHLINQTIFHIVVIALGYVMLYPILWMVFNSFKTNAEIFNSGVLLPSSWKLDNFVRGWQFNRSVSFSVFFKNSFYYTIISTIGAVIASSLVGYGFARVHVEKDVKAAVGMADGEKRLGHRAQSDRSVSAAPLCAAT